jgi:hypothetical protein
MAAGSKKMVRVWSHAEASRTLPYVRLLLGSLREGFITIWHLFRLTGYQANNPDHREQMRWLREEAVADLEELQRLGILAYDSPSRGIALFPFIVDECETPREAFLVYKDSRDNIDSFIFNDEFCEHNDLFGFERAVPDGWKQPGAVPKLEEVKP